MQLEFTLIVIGFVVVFMLFTIIYRYLVSLDEFTSGIAYLLARTFEHYYTSHKIKPQAVNWGIDLIWNPNGDDTESKRGFVTIWYGEDSGVDTPIEDAVEADILGQKFIEVIDKHIQDKEIGTIQRSK